jgi:hypothetical protein
VTLLFDTSADEPTRRKARARKAAPVFLDDPPTKNALINIGKSAPAPLGVLDDSVACVDSRCQAQCHDIIDEIRGQWFIECVFCGTGQWVPAVRGHLPEPVAGGDFVLRGGRFDGRTIAAAARDPRGIDYLRWAAKEHPRPAVQKACETYLASIPIVG